MIAVVLAVISAVYSVVFAVVLAAQKAKGTRPFAFKEAEVDWETLLSR